MYQNGKFPYEWEVEITFIDLLMWSDSVPGISYFSSKHEVSIHLMMKKQDQKGSELP